MNLLPNRASAGSDDDFEPLSRITLNDQIYRQIKDRLVTGQFAPGQPLPLRGLAKALGVSAMPVRDALQRLESIGVLVMKANRSMVVPKMDAPRLGEIRDIRVALEGLAAERAAKTAVPTDHAALNQHLDALRRAAEGGDAAEFLQANWLIHRGVAVATHSDLFLSMIEPLWLRMGPSIRLSKPDRARMLEALPCHAALVTAIAEGDGARARAAVVADITGCFDMLETLKAPDRT